MANDKDFLGTGWSFPPTFSAISYAVEMVSNDQDIRESLWVLFSTHLGERVMVPQYGCDLWRMVFRTMNTTLTTQIKKMVSQAILNWEPRITVDSIQIQEDPTDKGRALIVVDYLIRKTNTRSNMVYPFYLAEATIPAEVV